MDHSIEEDEDDDDDDDAGDNNQGAKPLGDGAEGVVSSGGSGTADVEDDSELPPELRMDDYDNEPGLTVTGETGAAGSGDLDVVDAMEEEGDGGEEDDSEEEDGDEGDDEEDEATAETMGVSFMEEPSTGQVLLVLTR